MGREIVYCWKCAKRLGGDDFDTLKAYRYGDKVSCDECVFDLVGDLPAEEQEAILNGTAGTKKSSTQVKAVRDTSRRTAAVPKAEGTSRVPRTGQTGKVPTADGAGTRSIPRKSSTRPIPKVEEGAGTRSIPRKGMTRSIPRVESPVEEAPVDAEAAAKKKKLLLIGAGGGGLLLIVVVVLAFLLMGGKKKPATKGVEATETAAAKADKTPAAPKLSREEAAKKAYDAAMGVFRDKPDDLPAKMKALRAAELEAAGTSLEESVAKQIEVLGLEIDKQSKALDEELRQFTLQDKFKEALDLLAKAISRHDIPEWQQLTEKKTAFVRSILEDRYLNAKKAALDAKDAGETAKVNEFLAKIGAWELPEYVERLKKDLGAAAGTPEPAAPDNSTAKTPVLPGPKKPKREAKPLSKEMQAYLPGWERAAGLAFQRDFDGAMTEIRKAAKEVDSDEVRKEAGVDVDLLEAAKAWVEEAAKLQASTKRLDNVALEIHDRPGEFKIVTGKVTKVFDQRLELRVSVDKDGKKVQVPLFVEYADLTGRSLGEQVKKLRKPPGKNDAKMTALICLLEGNEESAQGLGGREAEALPERYWVHAPNAKEKAPKSNGKEFEARNLYHKAEVEYLDIQTWGPALEKYKSLSNEYSTTRIVQRNQQAILKRGEVGKEYSLNARTLKTEGTFKPAKKPDLVLQATKDVDIQDMRENYVEAQFYGLAGVTYRCWALIGGCCKETFGFYLQTSDRTTSHQGKQIPIDPGANMAEQAKHQISGLKNDHAAHKPKDPKAPHPKDAVRWEWVPIQLPKTYTAAGPKGVRLLTDQAGFAVKFIVVSSLRTKTPDEKDTAELVRALAEAPAAEDSGVKGTPEAKEWLLAGPFDEPLNKVNPPEKEIDLAKEMTGKGGKKFKWKLVQNAPAGGYSTFNWEDAKQFNPKDNASAYALLHVKAPSPMSVQLSLGADDGIKVWVNDEAVYTNDKGGGVKNDEFKAKASLEEGWNRILIKVRNGTGGFGFSLRILDDAGAPAKDLEYGAYGDQLVPP